MKKKPKFGQNFLVSEHWQKKIVDSFKPPAAFAEIGPGKGALTKLLEKKFSNFFVFEIDREMLSFHSEASCYQVFHQDFLDWDFSLEGEPVQNFSLISNLPYESGTRILLSVLEHSSQISHFVFMLQREVVERICAKESTKNFAALSVLSQGQYEISSLGIVKPGAFRPAPKVDSAVIRGQLRTSRHPNSPEYRSFIFEAFRFKRKTLKNCLKARYDSEKISGLFSKFSWSDKKRAEEVPVEVWPQVYRFLSE